MKGASSEESTSTVLSSQAAWYNSSGWSGQGAYAFSEQEYEQSPLNRVLKARKPGSTYAKTVSGSKYANLSYAANASSDVRKLTVSASGALVSNGYYPAGTLHKTTATDEDGSVTVTWTDVLGHTVLSRQTANSQPLDTYYVYDDAGQLRWVVTPEGSAAIVDTCRWSLNDGTGITDVNSSNAAKYCYIYTWDGLGRQLSRKIPGKAVEHFVYDRAGRLVMTQDGLQRSSSKWVTMRYDNAGRLIRRALLSSSQSRTHFQGLFNSSNYPSEVYPSSGDTLLESFDYGTYSRVPSELAFTPVSGVTPQVD